MEFVPESVWGSDSNGEKNNDLYRDCCSDYKKQEEELRNQAGCLNLVTNAVVTWNTVYMAAVIDRLRAEGKTVNEEDIARLSPARYEHIDDVKRLLKDQQLSRGLTRLVGVLVAASTLPGAIAQRLETDAATYATSGRELWQVIAAAEKKLVDPRATVPEATALVLRVKEATLRSW